MLKKLLSFCLLFSILIQKSDAFLTEKRNHTVRQRDAEIDDLKDEFYDHHLNFMKTGIHSERLKELYQEIEAPRGILRIQLEDLPKRKLDFACFGCRIIVPTFFAYRRVLGMSDADCEKALIDVCINIRAASPHVCRGLIKINLEPILYVVDNQPKLTPRLFCAFALQGSCGEINDPTFHYSIAVDGNYPESRKNTFDRKFNNNKKTRKDVKTFKIVHMTDIHFDPNYVTGNDAQCGDPTCCRKLNGKPKNVKNAAGAWGDYNCDIPWNTVENMMQHIKLVHSDAEIFYYTGDTVDHGIWETSSAGNLNSMKKLNDYFRQELKGKMLFQILGNHEAHPVNIYSPKEITKENLSMNYLYGYIANAWNMPQSTKTSLRRGGYYSHVIRPGYRVIGLNNNVCYNINWWVMYRPQEHTVQFNWLHNTLLAAEKNKENVHILLHQPPGGQSCYFVWAREYQKIIDRFYHIIKGQFTGHTHKDEFNIYYSSKNQSHAINAVWNGGSLVTHVNVNPSYRVYYVDEATLEIVDADTWYFDLTEANKGMLQVPAWKKMYSFKQTYGLNDLTPGSLDKLVLRLAENRKDLIKYWQFRYKLANVTLQQGCDDECLLDNLCTIVVNQVGETKKCNELKRIFKKSKKIKY